jgi:hypothetical protein
MSNRKSCEVSGGDINRKLMHTSHYYTAPTPSQQELPATWLPETPSHWLIPENLKMLIVRNPLRETFCSLKRGVQDGYNE